MHKLIYPCAGLNLMIKWIFVPYVDLNFLLLYITNFDFFQFKNFKRRFFNRYPNLGNRKKIKLSLVKVILTTVITAVDKLCRIILTTVLTTVDKRGGGGGGGVCKCIPIPRALKLALLVSHFPLGPDCIFFSMEIGILLRPDLNFI